MTIQVFAFEVSVVGREWSQTINARSVGAAKYEYWRDVRDAWPDIPFTAIRGRKIGAPVTSREFQRVADYRGISIKCGDRVTVEGGSSGVVVGHNDSCNIEILFDETSEFPAMKLSVHPGSIESVSRMEGRR